MHRFIIPLLGTSTFGLTACGTQAVDASTNSDTSYSATANQAGTSAPDGLPGGFTIYPNATNVANNTYRTDTGFNTIVNFDSDDAPATITAFYKKQADAAGFTIQLDSNQDGMAILVAENAEKMAFAISASPSSDGAVRTETQLTIGQDSR